MQSLTSENFYIFSVPRANRHGLSVVVAFCASMEATPLELTDQLMFYFDGVSVSDELWVVCPEDMSDHISSSISNQNFRRRVAQAGSVKIRQFGVTVEGRWESRLDQDPVSKSLIEEVYQAGLRRLFIDSGGVFDAQAGYHFVKPSNKHTEHFVRTGNLVTRYQHVIYIAAGLLPFYHRFQPDRVWVDTSSIAPIAYGLIDLHRRLDKVPSAPVRSVVVDSFGGYERIRDFASRGGDSAVVLISASTSGGIFSTVANELGVELDRQTLLFYISDEKLPASILCDLTLRGQRDESGYVRSFQSWDARECPACANGQPALALTGDSFLPPAGAVNKRMLVKKDAPAGLSEFFEVFLPSRALRVEASDESKDASIRPIIVRLAETLDDAGSHIRSRFLAELKSFLPISVRWLIHLPDEDSRAVGRLALEAVSASGLNRDITLVSALDLNSKEYEKLGGGAAVVLAGAVTSGRSLLNVSRMLRLAHDGHDIRYFVGVGRTQTEDEWKSLKSSLQFGPSGPGHYQFKSLWQLNLEDLQIEVSPWKRELSLWNEVKFRSPLSSRAAHMIETRIGQLTGMDDGGSSSLHLFLDGQREQDAKREELILKPNFAFWDFDYYSVLRSLPTYHAQASVYVTMSCIMHNARYSSDGRFGLFADGPARYILAPGNFERYNDPVIRACMLRAARFSELDYSAEKTLSSVVQEIIIEELEATKNGEESALEEFLLSLVYGARGEEGGLRLHPDHRARIHSEVSEASGQTGPIAQILVEMNS